MHNELTATGKKIVLHFNHFYTSVLKAYIVLQLQSFYYSHISILKCRCVKFKHSVPGALIVLTRQIQILSIHPHAKKKHILSLYLCVN